MKTIKPFNIERHLNNFVALMREDAEALSQLIGRCITALKIDNDYLNDMQTKDHAGGDSSQESRDIEHQIKNNLETIGKLENFNSQLSECAEKAY